MPAAEAGRIPHVRALDGLRGVAVAAVVLYHFAPEVLPGGFLGVDVFFVLSGFLIASLVMREATDSSSVRLGRFWVRRARRLMPALLLLLVVLSIYAAWLAPDAELAQLRSHGLATLGYFANWQYIGEGITYGGLFAGPSPLLHTWSLAIEEQFYLFFPLLVVGALAMTRRDPWRARKVLLAVSGIGIVGSAAAMAAMYKTGGDPSRIYFGTDTRVHVLLVGVVLGVLLQGMPPTGRSARWLGRLGLGAAALVVVALATAHEHDGWLYRGGFLAFALATALVIAGSRRSRVVKAVLETRPLVALGVISYGVYLWHWPVFVLLGRDELGVDGAALFAMRVAITLAISIASYVLVERPIRHGALGRRTGRVAVVFAPVAMAGAALVLISSTGVATPDAVSVAARRAPPPSPPSTAVADAPRPLRVVIVGDSVAHTLAGGVLGGEWPNSLPWDPSQTPFDPARVELWSAAKPACSYLPGTLAVPEGDGYVAVDFHQYCGDWQGDLHRIAEVFAPDYFMVFLANDLADQQVDGRIVKFGTPEHDQMLLTFFDQLLTIAADHDAELVFLTPPPEKTGRPGLAEAGGWRQLALAELMKRYASDREGVHVLDLANALCPDGNCANPEPGFDDARFDGLHYTTEGAQDVATWVTPLLEEIPVPAKVPAPSTLPTTLPRLGG